MYATSTSDSTSTFIAKVYSILTAAVGLTCGVAYLAVTSGAPSPLMTKRGEMMATPAVHFAVAHPIIIGLGFLGMCLLAALTRKIRGIGLLTLGFFATVTGIFLGPVIALANFYADLGITLTTNPVRDAGLLTLGAFVGLSAYALGSRKDFSYMGAGLFSGLLLLIVAGFLNIFFQSAIFGLAIASVTVLLFVGFILYDTSNLIHGDQDDPIGAATELYLDVLNMFSSLLRIFMTTDD